VNKKTVARRYASALFNLLDPSNVEAARSALLDFSRFLHQSPAFKHVLASPVFSFEEKQGVLDELNTRVGSPDIMRAFLGQLLKKSRVGFLPEIAEAFGEIVDQQKQLQHVWVSSARDMSAKEKKEIQAQLGSRLKREVKVSFHTDPNLIAGLEIRIGSRVFDNSVRGKLANMRALLEKG
jgi:F-type H+-transporting ATPase subunit delta